MIIYDFVTEAWVKIDEIGRVVNDGSFFVSMTLENAEECEMVFFSETEFWEWYNQWKCIQNDVQKTR